VTFKYYITGAAAVNGLLKGEVDITGASEFVIATKALENAKLYTFGSYCKSDKFYVLARADNGIDRISDLKGKTIGYPKGTNGEFYLGRFLELNGINSNDVTLIDMAPFVQTPMALANGTVDAAILFQPYIDEARNLLANHTVMWSAQAGQLAYIDAICTEEWGASHPELIKRFLKSLIEAESFTLYNEEEAMEIVAKTLDYSNSYLASVWSDYQFSVSLDQAQIVAMEDEARWLITNNLAEATKIPNFNDFVYIDILAQMKPESVNIIR
jgi:NitT/TauT family transport system substrate-binding protein